MSPETCHKQTGTMRVGNWADVDSFVFFKTHHIPLVASFI
jgi:hypothetical protein